MKNLIRVPLNQNHYGQAMLEYLLMLVFAITVLFTVGTSFRQSTIQVWGYYIKQITAACPGCPADPSLVFH